jgi:hypothetical protein
MHETFNELYNDITEDVNNTFKDLFDDIIYRTPIDTGATRANYALMLSPFNKMHTQWRLMEHKKMLINLRKDKLILSNSTPYLEGLENGSSRQAPLGVFLITLIDFKRKLKRLNNGL